MFRSKTARIALLAAVALAVVAPIPAMAQGNKLHGQINDYTDPSNSAGAWHVSGPWSAKVAGDSGKGEFTASLGMVRVGSGASPHAHHVLLLDASVTATDTGYVLAGPATITSNGNAAMAGSIVTVELTGGGEVLPAAVRITFEGPAAGHFGTAPLDGVVAIEP
jgi:hypothetical protein